MNSFHNNSLIDSIYLSKQRSTSFQIRNPNSEIVWSKNASRKYFTPALLIAMNAIVILGGLAFVKRLDHYVILMLLLGNLLSKSLNLLGSFDFAMVFVIRTAKVTLFSRKEDFAIPCLLLTLALFLM